MSDDDVDQSPQDGTQRQRSRSRDRVHPYAQTPQTPPVPAPPTPPKPVPQTPPVPPIQPMVIQEPARAPVHVSPSADEESAAVEPQSRVSDRSRSPQGKERAQGQEGKKNTAEVMKPRDLPKAKTHKPMDSDEDDEEPQIEPGTSSNLSLQYQYLSSQDQHPVHYFDQFTKNKHRPVPVLRMNPLTAITSTEKENLAQQYRVHGVMTQEGQCSRPLCSDQ